MLIWQKVNIWHDLWFRSHRHAQEDTCGNSVTLMKKKKEIIVDKNSVMEQSLKAKHWKDAKNWSKSFRMMQNLASLEVKKISEAKYLKRCKELKQKLTDAKTWCKKGTKMMLNIIHRLQSSSESTNFWFIKFCNNSKMKFFYCKSLTIVLDMQ